MFFPRGGWLKKEFVDIDEFLVERSIKKKKAAATAMGKEWEKIAANVMNRAFSGECPFYQKDSAFLLKDFK